MRLESAEPRRDVSSDDRSEPNVLRRLGEPEPEVGRHVDAAIDESARLYAQNAVASRTRADASGGPEFNDRILYVGMNGKDGQCDREARSLAYGGNVVVGHSERDRALGADHVLVGGRPTDLATAWGALDFAMSIGLPRDQASGVARAILNAPAGSRDELAGIASVWVRAEHGERIPSRLVLSGHCWGNSIWDGGSENLGELSFSSLRSLARAMPHAAAQVEDLMISACSSGFDGESATGVRFPLSTWKEIFPNLKTAWGYGNEHHSPTGAQAIAHIAAWAHATRGRVQSLDGKKAVDSFFDAVKRSAPDPSKIGKPQLDGNVSVWTVSQGYVPGRG